MEIQQLAKQYVYWPEVDNKYQKNVDLSKVKLSEIHPLLDAASEQNKEPVIRSIAKFYSLNEALAKIRNSENDILGPESMKLYQLYTQEIDKLSKDMFAYIFTICIMEARHCEDYANMKYNDRELEEEFSYQPNGRAKIEKKSALFKKRTLKSYRHGFSSLGEFKRSMLVHDLIEPLSDMEGYDRVGINENFIPLLLDAPFCDLTISEVLKSLSVIFDTDHFESGYGGEPWAKIAEHALKFVKGEINAEVFVDQAFSLEHNGGQIFNKALIFKKPEQFFLYTDTLDNKNGNCKYVFSTQVLLNMQHHGQLLNFLTNPIPEFNAQILSNDASLQKAMACGWFPEKTHADSYRSVIDSMDSNITHLRDLQVAIMGTRYKQPDDEPNEIEKVFNEIKSLNIQTDPLNTFTVFTGLKHEYGEWNLAEDNKKYHDILDQLMYNNEIPKPQIKKKKSEVQFVFEHFDTAAIPAEKMSKDILGNKAFGLAQMQTMNLPVPKAMVFPATNSESFFYKKTEWQKNLKTVLPQMKEYFKDENGQPVLCSIRSGSAISMPGMMDTILNVGIDNTNYEQFCDKLGKGTTNECAIKFMTLFTKSLLNENVKFPKNIESASSKFRNILANHNIPHNKKGLFPLKAEAQYQWCLQAVFSSWHSERATAYRNHHNISHDIGTAAIAQQMVFGNLNNNSCTGVAFSRDCISGDKGIIGEFLPKAQGEDVVSGAVTPLNIKDMPVHFPEAYNQLVQICEKLEKDTGEIQDIEFTVENKKLYILQKRKAVSSDLAVTKLNYELVQNKVITKEKMLSGLTVKTLISQDMVENKGHKPEVSGLIANPGVLRGIIVHDESDMETYKELYQSHAKDKNFGWIFYAPETSPDHAPIMIKTHGFITGNGGFTSHAAILARSWKKPCVVGIGEAHGEEHMTPGKIITLDATNGHIYNGFLPLTTTRNNEVKKIVNTLLKHHKVDLKTLKKDNTFNELINEINAKPTWMESFSACKFLKPKIKPQLSNFLKLGDKIAMLIVKAQENNFYGIEEKLQITESSDSKIIKEKNIDEFAKNEISIDKPKRLRV
jgi:pyruvate,orthophosphate dikinase